MSNAESQIDVIKSSNFIKDLKRLRKRYDSIENDIEPVILQLEAGETPGDRIAENKYLVYKVRVKNSNARRGKSGGYRIIYYIFTAQAILLTSIYSKSDRANISNDEIESIIEQYILEIEQRDPDTQTQPSDREKPSISSSCSCFSRQITFGNIRSGIVEELCVLARVAKFWLFEWFRHERMQNLTPLSLSLAALQCYVTGLLCGLPPAFPEVIISIAHDCHGTIPAHYNNSTLKPFESPFSRCVDSMSPKHQLPWDAMLLQCVHIHTHCRGERQNRSQSQSQS